MSKILSRTIIHACYIDLDQNLNHSVLFKFTFNFVLTVKLLLKHLNLYSQYQTQNDYMIKQIVLDFRFKQSSTNKSSMITKLSLTLSW